MAHETAGDPVRGSKWTRRTTAKIAAQLGTLGIDVCARTVARLLKAMGFSLRVNHKKLAGASHPNRNDQFEHITALREPCAAENAPVISVDIKKKKLVGAFKNAGSKWDRSLRRSARRPTPTTPSRTTPRSRAAGRTSSTRQSPSLRSSPRPQRRCGTPARSLGRSSPRTQSDGATPRRRRHS